jgi:hypothetical protein
MPSSHFVWWLSTRVLAPFFALAMLAMGAYSALHPNKSDLVALHIHPGEFAVLIGVSAVSRAYFIVPRSISTGTISSVERTESPPYVAETGGFGLIAVIWLICLFDTWYYWLRPYWNLTFVRADAP